MSTYTVVTAQDGERFHDLSNRMVRARGPAFLDNDSAVTQYWHRLPAVFPDNQFCLVDKESGQAAGRGNSIPVAFTGEWRELPDEGLDWVLEKGFQDQLAGRTPTLMSALYIEIAATHRGRHLSGQMLTVMRQIARSQGFNHLIAPVRPSLKSSYPLIDIETYLGWRTPKGLPFDPWVRVHTRLGGQILHSCRRAMTIAGTREQWESWTGMDFPGDGDYVIPYGLVPVRVAGDRGDYVEPGVWVLHHVKDEE